ncbi:MAG: hypothetical protein RL357_1867 [Pseudomonadota bacterium]
MNTLRWMALQPSSKRPDQAGPSTPALANWCTAFTPDVYVWGEGVALDAHSVTAYWGGATPAWRRFREAWPGQWGISCDDYGCSGWGATVWQALARARCRLSVRDTTADQLPLWTLPETERYQKAWYALGMRTWGDLRRLPRGSVARRWGKRVLEILDQAYGDRPSELLPWQVPAQFDTKREWARPATHWSEVDEVMPAMLQEMVAWLVARQRQAKQVEWVFAWDTPQIQQAQGRDQREIHLIASAEPTHDFDIWWRLTRLHREHWKLSAPIVALELKLTEDVPASDVWKGLWDRGRGRSLPVCLEEMRTRWGGEGVSCAQTEADPIPERMQTWVSTLPVSRASAVTLMRSRVSPSWLLDPPVRLWVKADRPWYQGPLRLVLGPQRVGAWPWSDVPQIELPRAVRRDYFVAWSERVGWLWIYREAEQWFLHGVYA